MPDHLNSYKTESEMSVENSGNIQYSNFTCWSNRSHLERCTIVALVAVSVIGLGLASLLAYLIITHGKDIGNDQYEDYEYKFSEEGEKEYCDTADCVTIASRMLQTMNASASPCEDFYHFACSTFIKDSPYRPTANLFTYLEVTTLEEMTKHLKKKYKQNESKAFKLSKIFYKNCIDANKDDDKSEEKQLNSLSTLLKKFGGWPVVEGEGWERGQVTYEKFIYNNIKYGFATDSIFYFHVKVDDKDSTRRRIYIEQPSFMAPSRSFLKGDLEDEGVQAYLDYQVDLAKLLGAKEETVRMELEESLLFEMEIANLTEPEENLRNLSLLYNEMTIEDLEDIAPDISWEEYFSKMLSVKKVKKNKTVVIRNPKYLRAAGKRLQNVTERALSNYMIWKVVLEASKYMVGAFEDSTLKFKRKIRRNEGKSEVELKCTKMTIEELPLATHFIYMQNVYEDSQHFDSQEMIRLIQDGIENSLGNISWMEKTTIKEAIKKGKRLKTFVGKLVVDFDEEYIDNYYENLELEEETLLESHRKIVVFKSKKSFRSLAKKTNEESRIAEKNWLRVSPDYDEHMNAVYIPVPTISSVLFGVKHPNYLKYGSLGFFVGREMAKAFFDEKSLQYDDEGNLKVWWTSASKKNLKALQKCFSLQYEAFNEDKFKIKEKTLRGSRLVDLGGLKQAYASYQQWVLDNLEEVTLPGMNYTQNQLFWLTYGQLMCPKLRSEYMESKSLEKNHIPKKFTANFPLRNLEEFSNDWNCKLGSSMNPENKCVLW